MIKFTHNLDFNSKFYFVHSITSLNNPDDIVSKSKYGLDFTSATTRIFMEFSFILKKVINLG